MEKLNILLQSKKSILNKKGIYILHWYSGDKPREIYRLVGVDSKGILYIGCTKKRTLIKRLENVATVFQANKKQMHTLGIRLHTSPLKGLIKLEDIYVSYTFTEEAEKLEKQEISKYIKKHGEEPPLNSKILNPSKS
jgi:hypothetical protein